MVSERTSKPRVIALSQRVQIEPAYGERRDALDQQWLRFLATFGMLGVPVPNGLDNVADFLSAVGADGLLLTGGNSLAAYGGDAPERDRVERAMLEWGIASRRPVMGVCRGLQFLQVYFGGELVSVEGHVGQPSRIRMGGCMRDVNSYHNFGIITPASGLEALACAEDGTIEAVKHETHRIMGIMWHPERVSPFDPLDTALFSRFFEGGTE